MTTLAATTEKIKTIKNNISLLDMIKIILIIKISKINSQLRNLFRPATNIRIPNNV